MRRLLPLLLLASCSKGPQADLQYISQARSAAAEWALVNEQARLGKLTAHYVATMRQSLRREIQSSHSALTAPESAYAREMQTLLHEPDDAPPQELRARAARLKVIEDGLESA